MEKSINNRKDVLLLLLYSPGVTAVPNEPVSGRTRLTKMLFLFREEVMDHFRAGTSISSENFYTFFPWDFGPFSKQVYDDLSFFMLRGFIELDSASGSDDEALPEEAAEWEEWVATNDLGGSSDDAALEFQEEVFRLSSKGLSFTAALYEQLTNSQKKLLQEFKKRTAKVSLRTLLQYVYSNFPEQIQKSKIREQVLGHYLV